MTFFYFNKVVLLSFYYLINDFFLYLNSGESVSTDTIRNCIKMLEKLNAVQITSTTGVRLISLGQIFDSPEGVQSLIHKIQSTIPM